MFARTLEQFGDAPALLTESGSSLSYTALAQAADAFAATLGNQRQLLLIDMVNAVESVIAYLGALRGGHPVILSAGQTAQLTTSFAPNALYHIVDGVWQLDRQTHAPRHDLYSDLALMLSTSGTTGSAKLVRLSSQNLHTNAVAILEYLRITQADRAITTLPLHYSYGLSVLNSHLAAGASIVVGDWALTSPDFVEVMKKYAVTNLAGVPYSYELLEKSPFTTAHFPMLRYCTQAGGKMPVTVIEKWDAWARARGIAFFVMYGQTEATARMSYMPPAQLARHAGSIGNAIPGGAFHLIDDDGRVIEAADTVGELVYRGPNVMLGYAETITDLALPGGSDELRTGDLAMRDAEGYYTITGRRKRISKVFGLRLSLDEIEAQLLAMGESAYVAGDDAQIVIATIAQPLAPMVIDSLAARYGLPKNIFMPLHLTTLPRLANGKVDYTALLAHGQAQRQISSAQIPTLSPLRHLFAELAPNGQVEDGDSFTSLGSDSLSYVRASIVVEEQLGHLPERWEEMTLTQLEALSRAGLNRSPSLWRWHEMEMMTAVRAAAIVAVVCVHLLPHGSYAGGAELLMALAGLSLGKNGRNDLIGGQPFRPLRNFFLRIIVPYFILLAAYSLVHPEKFRFDTFLLLGNLRDGRRGDMLSVYWFLEAYGQILLLLALLFSLTPLRRFATRRPDLFGWCFVAASLLLKWIFFPYFGHTQGYNRTPDAVLYLIAFGWQYAVLTSTLKRILLIIITVMASLLTWGFTDTHPLFLGAGFLLILLLPRLRMPGLLTWPLSAISLSSMYIYLSHCFIRNILVRLMPDQYVLWRVLLTLATGWAIWWSVTFFTHRWQARSRQVPSP